MSDRKALLDVLLGRMPARRPLWFMRQAGRYLAEYREVRDKAGSFLNLCYSPEMAAKVTLQPLRRFDLDAAIVFADILVVPHAMGCDLSFVEGEGPRLSMVRNAQDVGRLRPVMESWQCARVQETLRRVKEKLQPSVALIGFCGAPWTVASYLIEGGSSQDRMSARCAALREEAWFVTLMQMLEDASIDYLSAQVEAGAEVVQIFESWGGDVPWPLQGQLVVDPIRRIINGLRSRGHDVPVIVFARGFGASHARIASGTGANAVSVESQVDLVWATTALACALQGNLDPAALVAGGAGLDQQIEKILSAVPKERHVFNLGHGIVQETPVGHVAQMVDRVRRWDG